MSEQLRLCCLAAALSFDTVNGEDIDKDDDAAGSCGILASSSGADAQAVQKIQEHAPANHQPATDGRRSTRTCKVTERYA